jgi:hypothetical protein
MPLIKGTSTKSFGKNVATEMSAGKPQKQAVAIAYSEQHEAESSKGHHAPKHTDTAHHSDHSSKRSSHYHAHTAGSETRPVEVMGKSTKMHKSEHAPASAEDTTEKGHKL